MRGVYGTYEHQDNTIQIATVRKAVFGRTNLRTHYAIQMMIRGVLRQPDGNVEELTAKLQALEAAYAVDDQSFILYDNNNEATVHQIDKDQTLNGVRVVSFRYVPGARAEYFNRRSYEIILQAEILDPESQLVHWQESIALLAPGTTDFVIQESLASTALYQQTAAFTKMAIRQSGSAIGLESYPTFPDPYYPGFMKPRPFLQQSETPLNWGLHAHTHYPIRWSYHFEAPSLTPIDPPNPTF